MRRNTIETLLGAVVLLVALTFLAFAYQSAPRETASGYQVKAYFTNIGGLGAGGAVKLSGVKIGNVSAIELDAKTYRAAITMTIEPDVKLPTDSSAGIASAGLLGDTYLNIVPGGDEEVLKDGGEIKMTQPSVDLVEMLGKFVFSVADSKKDNKTADPVTLDTPQIP